LKWLSHRRKQPGSKGHCIMKVVLGAVTEACELLGKPYNITAPKAGYMHDQWISWTTHKPAAVLKIGVRH
jgi:hypothetical protein